ncbi:astacin-like [Tubulanus polymorphus]|uniref:astacin-like n=1 Tax=Tubulanus polymorphus TaxID=672921 RepID=UPI003DA20751
MWIFCLLLVTGVMASPVTKGSIRKPHPEEAGGFIEGDIMPDPVEGQFRSTIKNPKKFWTDGIVPYKLDDPTKFSEEEKRNLTLAMEGFHKHTCVRWVPYTDQPYFILFRRTQGGCSSGIGMSSNFYNYKGQRLLLGEGCFIIGTIRHEMMHALGFYHEQSRWDRDKYITINQRNVLQGRMGNFRLFDVDESFTEIGAPYDYGSLMHYPRDAFSTSETEPTIVTIEPGVEIGQRRDFSEIDIFKINTVYKCTDKIKPLPESAFKVPTPIPTVAPEPPTEVLDRFTWRCYFDLFWACGMHDDLQADMDWTLKSGPSSTEASGPASDYDGKYEKFYMYTESTGRHAGNVATLVSPYFAPTTKLGDRCFSFAYHMRGPDMGTFRVYLKDYTGAVQELFTASGDHGDKWMTTALVLKSDKAFEIYFEHTLGQADPRYNTNAADLAIDTIKMRPLADNPCEFSV